MRINDCTKLIVAVLSLLSIAGNSPAASAVGLIPPDAAMAKADMAWQRVLISACQQPSAIRPGGWRMNNTQANLAPSEIAPKFGQTAAILSGEAVDAASKGHFQLAGGVPGVCRWLGMWVYLAPDANVRELGVQASDQEGESFIKLVPADWKGWKWVELETTSASMQQAYPQPEKYHKIDGALGNLGVVWFAKREGPTRLVLDGIAAVTSLGPEQAARPAEVAIAAADRLEPGQRFAGQLALTNYADAPAAWKVTYSLQTDGAMFNRQAPDPVYGSDRALGARSWTEADGKIIEEGSLTDGKDYTDAGTPYVTNHYTEALQYVDFGRTRKITRVSYLSGDANHVWKVDVAVSDDGKSYAAVPELQGFDMYKKWGTVVLPLRQPVSARWIRLRYHKDGEKTSHFRMPCRLSVYDGAADESWELPEVGDVIGRGEATSDVAPRSFAVAELAVEGPLAPGLYLLAARLDRGGLRQLVYRHVLVLPELLKEVSAESRFGINAANGNWAPVLRRLGVGWVRFENMKWPFVSPEPGVYRFDGSVKPWQVSHDAIFKAYHDAGLNVLPFLFMIPGYASGAPADVKSERRSFYPPKDPQQFAEFAFQVAARYGAKKHPLADLKSGDGRSGLGYLRVYEIWNEPNLTDPNWGAWVGTSQQYLELLRIAAEAVRRADPAAKVTNAGYAGIQVKTVNPLRTHTYADGKHPLDFIDILNVHFYSGRIPPEVATDDFNAHESGDTTFEQDLRRLAAWRDRYKPGMPIWLSETGYDSAGPYGTDERTQAARLPRVVMLALANGIDKVLVYRESGSTASMHAASGLLRDDGSMKPSWVTYATLIRQLDGVQGGAIRLPYKDNNVRLYAWQRGAERILTAWTIEGPAKLDVDLGHATVTDAFGRQREMDLAHGLALSEFPVYLRNVSDLRAIAALEEQARQEDQRREARRKQLAGAAAYLFKFGGGAEELTLDVGRPRSYTPVLAADVFNEERGYGFFPGPAAEDQNRKWIRSDLDRTVCKVVKGHEFRFRVAPGRYQLRLGVSPHGDAHVLLRGAAGGQKVLPVSKGDSIVETPLEATSATLSISVDNYGALRWLTVIQQLPAQ